MEDDYSTDYEIAMMVSEKIGTAIQALMAPRKENAILEVVFSQEEQTPSGGWVKVEAWMLSKDTRLKACWLDCSAAAGDPDYEEWFVDERRFVTNMAAFRLQRMAIGRFDELFAEAEGRAFDRLNHRDDEIPF